MCCMGVWTTAPACLVPWEEELLLRRVLRCSVCLGRCGAHPCRRLAFNYISGILPPHIFSAHPFLTTLEVGAVPATAAFHCSIVQLLHSIANLTQSALLACFAAGQQPPERHRAC